MKNLKSLCTYTDDVKIYYYNLHLISKNITGSK